MRRFPEKRLLIATSNGQSTKKYGYLARVEKELELAGAEHELFDEIRPNPTRDNVMAGAQKAKETGCDLLLRLAAVP
jgi:alcohol dehydrogenase